jgi:hypothetical protein
VIVILEVAVTAGQPLAAAIVFVTVYVPAVLAERFTTPVDVLTKTNPAADAENAPATPPPEKVGEGLAAF